MENVNTLLHSQSVFQRSWLFIERSKPLFSSDRPEVTEEYFSRHTSLSFIFQYVGVIFNHNIVEVPQCLFWNQGFFNILAGIFSNPFTFLSIQSHFPHPSQKSFEQIKEMTFDRRLANVTDPVVRGLYFPSTQNLIQKALHEITANSQS